MPGYEFGRLNAVTEFKEFPGEIGCCPTVREMVRTALREHRRIVDDAELAVSELFGNACRHTRSGEPGGTLAVSVSALVTGLAVVSVTDQGPRSADLAAGRHPLPEVKPMDPDALGWRGLHLVAEVTDDWGHTPTDEGGLTVWALFESPAFTPANLLR
ncbi:anti-sigma regulatory factor (Ser/Thr protein kinase) [Spinactinospora alkalitolerans]|uniref:Anti-sigma regulatory factor (Ser/Thr protein kinase) n=1 Tax=Spinactinospora alkalitolerans TaxID=687207 RepID=A0A852TVU9_9ACTN|nr:ATP-binding protein [Spinactinospora alkalitolerans]NYE46010.1 anti-sigma regulatory factor (Ser/Thr protein kinase) [Spinactinospora alkalitolerans]